MLLYCLGNQGGEEKAGTASLGQIVGGTDERDVHNRCRWGWRGAGGPGGQLQAKWRLHMMAACKLELIEGMGERKEVRSR